MLRILFHTLVQATLLRPILANPIPDASAKPDPNDLSAYDKTISIPYVYPFTSLAIPVISGSIEGTSFKFPVDTGSTGVLVSKSKLPSVFAKGGDPGHQFIESTGTLYVGRWVFAAVTFNGENKKQALSRVPVLVVDDSWYCPEYKIGVDKDKCPNKKAKSSGVNDVSNVGIGFGRGTAPKYNPFLNVKIIDGENVTTENFRNGYYIGTDGIRLGLTNNNTNNAAWVNLDQSSKTDDDRDWNMLKTSFKIDGTGPYSGDALIDTNVAQMYLQAPSSASMPNATVINPFHREEKIKVAKPGTKLKFGFPSLGEDGVSGYGFAVGDKKFPSQPYFVQLVNKAPGPFVNTGRKFFWGMSLAFDAVGGRLGFICLRCNDAE